MGLTSLPATFNSADHCSPVHDKRNAVGLQCNRKLGNFRDFYPFTMLGQSAKILALPSFDTAKTHDTVCVICVQALIGFLHFDLFCFSTVLCWDFALLICCLNVYVNVAQFPRYRFSPISAVLICECCHTTICLISVNPVFNLDKTDIVILA